MDSWEDVSHWRMWIFESDDLKDSRSVRSEDVERVVAMIMLSLFLDSCCTNSRPRPRLAPVTM